jgi:hypothetical protein
MDISKVKVTENKPDHFALFLSREMVLKIDKELTIELCVQLVLLIDDDKNFKLDSDIVEWVCIQFHGKKITGYENINKWIVNYNKMMSMEIGTELNKYIYNIYSKYTNEEIRSLAKEFNLTLPTND